MVCIRELDFGELKAAFLRQAGRMDLTILKNDDDELVIKKGEKNCHVSRTKIIWTLSSSEAGATDKES